MSIYTDMHTIIPPGSQGDVKIDHVEIDHDRARLGNLRGSFIRAGKYARLLVRGVTMMSDVPDERRSNQEFIHQAKGDVLIGGLGLGMVVYPLLENPKVTSITVIELNQNVIDLVHPHLAHEKLQVIQGDIFEWFPKGLIWDTIYFDIWPDICTDNLSEITRLKRRFGRRKRKGGWMGAWVEGRLRSRKKREDKEEKRFRFWRK